MKLKIRRTGRLGIGLAILAGTLSLSHAGPWSNGRPANRVLGQANFLTFTFGGGATKFLHPDDVAVDPATGKVFVADLGNNRVLRFASMTALTDGAAAEAVFGQANFDDADANRGLPAPTAATLNMPGKLDVDANGNLWVSDGGNHRVLRYADASNAATGAAAVQVLGKPDFVGSPGGPRSASTISFPRGLDFDDATGHLWVASELDHRILMFENAIAKGNGGAADGVLGQANFAGAGSGLTATNFDRPDGVATDGNGTVWVADRSNNRVLRFDNALTKAKNAIVNATSATADAVLGQPGFTSDGIGTAANTLNLPKDVAIDGDGSLWVGDGGVNHRILRYDDAAAKGNGADADGVLGQDDFVTRTAGAAIDKVRGVRGLAIDSEGNLWVAEGNNQRVVRFSPGNFQPDGWIGKKAARQKGDNVINGSGAGQLARVVSKNGRKVKLFATLENDGPAQDDFRVRGTRKNRDFAIKVFDTTGGRANVTGAVARGQYLAGPVASGGKRTVQIQIKPKGNKTRKTIKLSGTSNEQGTGDTVKGKVKVKH